jgi:hypothetical protein
LYLQLKERGTHNQLYMALSILLFVLNQNLFCLADYLIGCFVILQRCCLGNGT